MDHLWSPWRYRYVAAEPAGDTCLFCEKSSEIRDRENYVVLRGERNFVLLNLFPYTNGHMMIAPYEHVDTLGGAATETVEEMIRLTQRAERVLRKVYRPGGVNLGMNIGQCAGAGVAGHIHMHVLPRWPGDVNFMSAVGETRVHPEDLDTTWEKLREAFGQP